MSETSAKPSEASAARLARAARASCPKLLRLSNDLRSRALQTVAQAYEASATKILSANEADCCEAKPFLEAGRMTAAAFARLRITERGIVGMAKRLREVARLPDPLGKKLAITELDAGLVLHKETCPLGVVAVVFESRPDVAPQVASLALKSGNAILLKGGSEAAHTNEILVAIWKQALAQFPEIPEDALQLLHSRADVMELLALNRDVDLLIPRGGKNFVEHISRNSRIPVLGHGEGICHVYVDAAANLKKALAITLDSKTQYPAACNSAETLLVHAKNAKEFLPRAIEMLLAAGVELRGCTRTIALAASGAVKPATESDWSAEYSDLILSIKIVDDLDAAIQHIHCYGTNHTEAIVTEDSAAAQRFLDEIDAASVFQNASTRFADGYRYGLGSEVGVSNGKLHARGPMGMEGLTTYKYKLIGDGHTVAEYERGAKTFHHRALPTDTTRVRN